MTLGRYFESQASILTLREMLNPDRDLARGRADQFVKANPWVLATGIGHTEPNKEGDLLDRVWFHLIEAMAQEWVDLEKIMRDEQDVQQALEAARVITAPKTRAVNAAGLAPWGIGRS